MNVSPSQQTRLAAANWWRAQLELWLWKCFEQPDEHNRKALADLLAQYADHKKHGQV